VTPIPTTETARLKIFYTNAVAAHQCVVRIATATDAPEGESTFSDLTTAMTGFFHASSVVAVQIAAEGSNLFFPYASSTLVGHTWGSGTAVPDTNAQFGQFSGRSVTGPRAKCYLFGWKGIISAYKLTGAEDEDISAAVDILNSAEVSFLAIDGQPTIWYDYVNIKPNDHWVHKSRRGT